MLFSFFCFSAVVFLNLLLVFYRPNTQKHHPFSVVHARVCPHVNRQIMIHGRIPSSVWFCIGIYARPRGTRSTRLCRIAPFVAAPPHPLTVHHSYDDARARTEPNDENMRELAPYKLDPFTKIWNGNKRDVSKTNSELAGSLIAFCRTRIFLPFVSSSTFRWKETKPIMRRVPPDTSIPTVASASRLVPTRFRSNRLKVPFLIRYRQYAHYPKSLRTVFTGPPSFIVYYKIQQTNNLR